MQRSSKATRKIRWYCPRRERPVGERDLLRARAEQHRDEPLALPGLERHEPLEQAFEIGEEAGLALLDADQRRIAVRRDERDAAATRSEATSRWTSFVMSSTVRFGSAAAIETGISTEVTARRDLARQPEVHVLARDVITSTSSP